jgi:hypothetical protein
MRTESVRAGQQRAVIVRQAKFLTSLTLPIWDASIPLDHGSPGTGERRHRLQDSMRFGAMYARSIALQTECVRTRKYHLGLGQLAGDANQGISQRS